MHRVGISGFNIRSGSQQKWAHWFGSNIFPICQGFPELEFGTFSFPDILYSRSCWAGSPFSQEHLLPRFLSVVRVFAPFHLLCFSTQARTQGPVCTNSSFTPQHPSAHIVFHCSHLSHPCLHRDTFSCYSQVPRIDRQG